MQIDCFKITKKKQNNNYLVMDQYYTAIYKI